MSATGNATGSTARPSAFVSYAQSSDEWQRTILKFTVALRKEGGIDAEIDLFHTADHQQWSIFGPQLIDRSQFILIAVDATYRRRWEGREKPGVGSGVAREAAAIKAIFERDQKDALRRVKVIVLPGATNDDIPPDLFGFSERFTIETIDRSGLDALLRSLWGKPIYEKPPLGPIPSLPALSVAEVEQSARTADAGRDASPRAEGDRGHDPSQVDAEDAATLAVRLNQVRQDLDRARRSDADRQRQVELERERATLEASLEALGQASDVSSTPPEEVGMPTLSPMVQRLASGLNDPSSDIRYEALNALDEHLTSDLLPHIEPLLEDPDEFVKRRAYEYYGRLAS